MTAGESAKAEPTLKDAIKELRKKMEALSRYEVVVPSAIVTPLRRSKSGKIIDRDEVLNLFDAASASEGTNTPLLLG